MARIAVIGGGLAGLTAAHRLARARHSVLLLEAGTRLGGQIHTEHSDGYVVELGAEGFVARSEAVPRLAREVGIDGELAGQTLTRSLGYRAGALRELAPGEAAAFLGFQVARDDLGLGIRSFRTGMAALTSALERVLAAEAEVRIGFRVSQIERQQRGFKIRDAHGATLLADRLVLATSARSAAELLSPVVGAALDPNQAKTLSNVNVSLAYDRAAIGHALDATGFVLATEEQVHGARACTFVSSKFADRAPPNRVLLRVFVRPDARELKTLADATYVTRATALIARVLGANAPPLASWVARWPDALPVFDAASKQAVASLETALKGSHIAVAGSAFHGAGIDAAVRSAWAVEERL